MKGPSDLFELIRSLSGNEKRYFKRYASLHSVDNDKNYLRLFDAISGMMEYDEEKLLKELNDDSVEKQFSRLKNYLYHLILKSMRSYGSEMSIDIELRNKLNDIEFLYSKTLYKQCHKAIGKARELCYLYEKHSMLIELLKLENHLYWAESFPEVTENQLGKELQEGERILSLQKNEIQYLYLKTNFSLLRMRDAGYRNETQVGKIETLLKHALIKDEQKAITFNSKKDLNFILGIEHFFKNDYDACFLYAKKNAELFRQFPHQTKDKELGYMSTLINYSNVCIVLKKYDEGLMKVEEMKKIQTNSPILKAKIFANYYLIKFCILTHQANFVEAYKEIPEVEAGLERHKNAIHKSTCLTIYYDIFTVCFVMKDFIQAQRWLNKLLNSKPDNIRKDLYSFAIIINLVLQYELDNTDTLNYHIRSTQRYLKKEGIFAFENILLNYLQKELPKANSKKEVIVSFVSLKQKIEPLLNDPKEAEPLLQFDYIAWLESKINDEPLLKLLKRKAAEATPLIKKPRNTRG